jgi:hypothetical protein
MVGYTLTKGCVAQCRNTTSENPSLPLKISAMEDASPNMGALLCLTVIA